MIGQKGFALVLVLWVLSLLTIMAGSFALSMRRESAIVAGGSSNAQALAVAESGLAIAELMLMGPNLLQRWRADGSIYQMDFEDAKVRIRLLAETGKIDINTADQALLQGFLASAPLEPEGQTKLADAILDWRDEDDLRHLEGAEKDEYKKAGLSYQPRNKPFLSIEELQMVLGMNGKVYQWLENLVTVNSGQPKVDLTQASREVLLALPGMGPELVDSYIAARRESATNGLPAPAFVAGSGAQPGTGMASRQLGAVGNAPVTAIDSGTEQNMVVTLVAEAWLDDGTKAIINALVKKADNTGTSPFQVLKWQRNPIFEGSLFTDEDDGAVLQHLVLY